MYSGKIKKVINAMLAMQRHPWEQGVCAKKTSIREIKLKGRIQNVVTVLWQTRNSRIFCIFFANNTKRVSYIGKGVLSKFNLE